MWNIRWLGAPALSGDSAGLKALFFAYFRPFSSKFSQDFNSIKKLHHRIGVIASINVWKFLDDFLILESSTEDQLYRLLFMCRNFFYPYSFHVQFNPISLSKNNNQTPPSADAMGIIKKKNSVIRPTTFISAYNLSHQYKFLNCNVDYSLWLEEDYFIL